MIIFFFSLFFLLAPYKCDGQQQNGAAGQSPGTMNKMCGQSNATKYKLYQYGTKAVGTKNYHVVTTEKLADFAHTELIGSVLREMDDGCDCLMELISVHKDVTSWFGFARNIDNMLLLDNGTIPAPFMKVTDEHFYCAREQFACGASLALRILYNRVNDDHFYETKNDTETGPNDALLKEHLGILCYIWPADEGRDWVPVAKPITTRPQPMSRIKVTKKARGNIVKRAVDLLEVTSKETAWSSSTIGPIVTAAQMAAITSGQDVQPAITVSWDPSQKLSPLERANLYIQWYNASIAHINSVSNGTPADYRHFMPYYPGPPIFDDDEQFSHAPSLQPVPISLDYQDQTTVSVFAVSKSQSTVAPVSQSTVAPVSKSQSSAAPVNSQVITTEAMITRLDPFAVSNPPLIHGPSPIPAFNFSSDTVLTQIAKMNGTLLQFSEAYENWFNNTVAWMSQYYGVLPNGTRIDRVNILYNNWLNATQAILNNLLKDNPRFSSYLNGQPNKSLATQMMNHLTNPPPAQLWNVAPILSNSSSITGNFSQLQLAYAKWYSEANSFLQLSTGRNANMTGFGSSNPPPLPVNANQQKSINFADLNAAYHAWYNNNSNQLLAVMDQNKQGGQSASLLPLLNRLLSNNPSLQNKLPANIDMNQLTEEFGQWLNRTGPMLTAMGQSGASNVSPQSVLAVAAQGGKPLVGGSPSSALSAADRHTIDVNLGELVNGVIPQLLASSRNGTDTEALQTAYQQWYQQTHASLADYIKTQKSASQ